jgi:hypothetical protein
MKNVPAARHKVPAAHAAWWSGTLLEFRHQSDEEIVERLNLRLVEGHYTARADQLRAWRDMVKALREATVRFADHWRLLLEYPLLRLGRRLDAVLVTPGVIVTMEFKTNQLNRAGRCQAEDYALDLRDFHAGSRQHPIVPLLVAIGAKPAVPVWPLLWSDYENPVFEASETTLPALLAEIIARVAHVGVDIDGWEYAPYRPVPTIIEAARMLYRKHGVAEIKTAHADKTNLTVTTEVILQAIRDAKAQRRRIIVFVTGTPGAGKTLCGLDAVFSAGDDAAFLTGTLPMVYVLRAALAKDAVSVGNKSKRDAARNTRSNIQSINGFLRDNRDRPDPPAEHMIVFDEAQRAWDADYGARKFKLEDSEAGIVLDIMERHLNYAVIVALVGNGQEINTGEAGLGEWGRALSRRPVWQIRAPAGVINAVEPRQRLFVEAPAGFKLYPDLHLGVSIRQIRSAAAAPWVDAMVNGDSERAYHIARHSTGALPFFVTRSLADMRAALRARARGSHRAGLVCSSGAKRLVADGIWPKFDHLDEDAVANWFLKTWPEDIRASDALEIPATEFACQGLELDYVGLCWGGDFVWNGRLVVRSFAGTKWRYPRQTDAIDFVRNTYRVLLTRARYLTIIWVPEGDSADATREPYLFDQTASFLLECGARVLEPVQADVPEESPVMLL